MGSTITEAGGQIRKVLQSGFEGCRAAADLLAEGKEALKKVLSKQIGRIIRRRTAGSFGGDVTNIDAVLFGFGDRPVETVQRQLVQDDVETSPANAHEVVHRAGRLDRHLGVEDDIELGRQDGLIVDGCALLLHEAVEKQSEACPAIHMHVTFDEHRRKGDGDRGGRHQRIDIVRDPVRVGPFAGDGAKIDDARKAIVEVDGQDQQQAGGMPSALRAVASAT